MTTSSIDELDLTNCDREPIHIPGRIQPHGMLLVLSEPELQIIQVSDNTARHIRREPAALLGQPLQALLPPEYISYLRNVLATEPLDENPLYLWTVQMQDAAQPFDGLLHRYNGVLLLELEPELGQNVPGPVFYRTVKTTIGRLQQAPNFAIFCDATAQEVRALTGFDRVMVYQFDADGHGSVIAEAVRDGLESFLGLHYPASDIPKQARALYVRSWLRLIPNALYTPSEIVPTLTPGTRAPVDLSYAALRSVSPIHLEYLGNMGVRASMSISIIKDGELWGLIACHHYEPRYLPYELRAACEFLGQAVSLQLVAKENSGDYEYRVQLKDIGARLVQGMAQAKSWRTTLMSGSPNLLDLLDASGVALCVDDQIDTLGATPPERDIRTLLAWLVEQPASDVYATKRLASECPALAHCANVASGVLAAPIAREQGAYLLWFRPEVMQTVNWAGEPMKAVTIGADGVRLSPRKSFALWQQNLAGQSLPWKLAEIEAASELRNAILSVVLRRAIDLARLNTDLQRSNVELDAFAYIASHDLKEPLRGLHNYAHFLMEDYKDLLDADGQAKLQTMIRLTQRMETLLDSLLHYSRVGRVDLAVQKTDLNALLSDTLDMLAINMQQQAVDVRIPRPLPTIQCDRVRVGEVFQNLIANAVKYNTKNEKWVEIGWQEPDPKSASADEAAQYIFYIRDNGIGIPERHFDTIFRIFKRLHGREQFGGGAGAGLTIAKKIVERHGGSMWVTSEPDVGTTFFFTIQDQPADSSHLQKA